MPSLDPPQLDILLTKTGRRLMIIEQVLRAGHTGSGAPCTLAALGEFLKVSPATVKRDILLLRYTFGAPIVWKAAAREYVLSTSFEGLGARLAAFAQGPQ